MQALFAAHAVVFDLAERRHCAELVVPLDLVLGQQLLIVVAADAGERNGAAVVHGQRLLVRLELAKVVLVGARDRLNVALVREDKRRPRAVRVLAEPLRAGAELAVVLLLEELGARLTNKLDVLEQHLALVAALRLAHQTQARASIEPRVRVRAGLRRAAAEIFGERRQIVDLQIRLARIVDQPALKDLSLYNTQACQLSPHNSIVAVGGIRVSIR
jgi:hypothetical protein